MTLRFCRTPILKVWGCVEDPLTAMLEVEGIKISMEADTGAVVPLNSKLAHTKKAIPRRKYGRRKGTSQHIHSSSSYGKSAEI